MTSQPPLFVESYHDALYAVALALGGFKKALGGEFKQLIARLENVTKRRR